MGTNSPRPTDDPVLGSAGYLLLKAGHHIGIAFERAMRNIGLSMRELLVLSFVAGGSNLSQQDLSDRLGLDPTIVVGLVDGLESRDLVVRGKDPSDRRRNVLSVTPTGSDLHRRAIEAAAVVEDDFLGPLDRSESDALRAALYRVISPRITWME